jgi:FG-GAP repeat
MIMRAVLWIACLLLGGVSAHAQEILWQQIGKYDKEHLGGGVVAIGDRNGDGYDEFVETARYRRNNLIVRYLVVRSGKDGSVLKKIPPASWVYTYIYPAGDWNGDGLRDYALIDFINVSGNLVTAIDVRSGKDDSLIRRVTRGGVIDFGRQVESDLDLNADGKPDVLISAPGEVPPSLYAFSNSGKLLYKLSRRVVYLGKLGDVDGDRCDDYLVNGTGSDARGEIDILSGKTGKRIRTVYGERAGDYIGSESQHGVGDVDGDGVPDFAASTQDARAKLAVFTVFSGKTGKVLHSFRGLGGNLIKSGDLDLDGVADLLIGGGGGIPGHPNTCCIIYWFSLRDFTLTHRFLPPGLPNYNTALGSAFAIGRPRKGNPFPVLLTSEGQYGTNTSAFLYLGRMTLYRTVPKGVGGVGSACKGTLKQAPRIGLRSLGNKGARLHLNQAPAKTPALLLLGVSNSQWGGATLPLPLGFIGLPTCKLNTSLDLVVGVVTGAAGIDRGYAAVDIPIPLNGAAPKLTVYGQWLVWDSVGNRPGGLSAALSWKH